MKQLSLVLFTLLFAANVYANHGIDHYEETRYCGVPERTSGGRIKRDRKVIREFRKIHACPSTGKLGYTEPCPGWALDHIIPLANGGCDSVSNLQWLNNEIKSGAGEFPKDRWEREVYKDGYYRVRERRNLGPFE